VKILHIVWYFILSHPVELLMSVQFCNISIQCYVPLSVQEINHFYHAKHYSAKHGLEITSSVCL